MGISEFNSGHFFEAHETWEELWMEIKSHPQRKFLQGMIQIAAGFHKGLNLKHPTGMRTLLTRGLNSIEPFLPGAFGIECFHFYPDIMTCRDEAARIAAGECSEFNTAFIPRLPYQRANRAAESTRS